MKLLYDLFNSFTGQIDCQNYSSTQLIRTWYLSPKTTIFAIIRKINLYHLELQNWELNKLELWVYTSTIDVTFHAEIAAFHRRGETRSL